MEFDRTWYNIESSAILCYMRLKYDIIWSKML